MRTPPLSPPSGDSAVWKFVGVSRNWSNIRKGPKAERKEGRKEGRGKRVEQKIGRQEKRKKSLRSSSSNFMVKGKTN